MTLRRARGSAKTHLLWAAQQACINSVSFQAPAWSTEGNESTKAWITECISEQWLAAPSRAGSGRSPGRQSWIVASMANRRAGRIVSDLECGPMATKAGRDHEVEPDGWASPAAPSVGISMIMGNSRQIGHGAKSENISQSRYPALTRSRITAVPRHPPGNGQSM